MCIDRAIIYLPLAHLPWLEWPAHPIFGYLGHFLALVGRFLLFKALFKNILFVFRANVPFLTMANVPFFEQRCQKSRDKCVILRANVPFLTGINELRACDI